MVHIYNAAAEICSFVNRACGDDSLFVRYSCITAAARRNIMSDIRKRLPLLFEPYEDAGEPVIHCIKKHEPTEEFYNALDDCITELEAAGELFRLIGLAQVLDGAMRDILQEKIDELQEDDFSVVLNSNRERTGVGLLPRCSCVWERKHRLSQSSNCMDNFLCNILLLENTILGELIDKHYFLKDDFFSGFAQHKRLRIAATPLRREANLEVELYERDSVQYFRVRRAEGGCGPENEAVWQKIVKAAKENSDIVVFPEMLGNEETARYISARLKELDADERKNFPAMIILPSVWSRNMNTVTILNREGSILCRQSKQNPFRVEFDGTGYLEGIRPNMVVNIFHHEGIGRIAVLICKDFLTTKYMEQLMRCFKLTLIIVPSYSTGSYDFRQSFDLCAHDDCNVVWINTCAALRNGKESNFENIGYVRKRIGRSDDDSQKLCRMPICRGAFSGECSHDCIFFEDIKGV